MDQGGAGSKEDRQGPDTEGDGSGSQVTTKCKTINNERVKTKRLSFLKNENIANTKTEGPKGLGIFVDQSGASSKEDGQRPETEGDASGSQVKQRSAKP